MPEKVYVTKLNIKQTRVLLSAIEFYNELFYKRNFESFFKAFESTKDSKNFKTDNRTHGKFMEIIEPLQKDKTAECFDALEVKLERDANKRKVINVLTLDEKNVRKIISALDSYSRVLMGQFSVVFGDYRLVHINDYINNPELTAKHETLLQRAREVINPEFTLVGWNGSYGITSPEVPEESKIAYEMLGCLRHWLWLDAPNRRYYGVDSHLPLKCSTEPLLERIDG